jgi:hypothetical protein
MYKIFIINLIIFFLLLSAHSIFAQTDSIKQEKTNPNLKTLADSLKKQVKVRKGVFWLFKNKNKLEKLVKDSTVISLKDSLARMKRFKVDSLAILARFALDTLYGYGEGKMSLPTRAAVLSAALPGLGQYFNRNLWYLKVPVIYGLFGFTFYQITIYHKQYIIFRDALLYREDNNSLTVSDARYATFTNDGLRSRRDAFRRERDFNVVLTLGVYMLNIAEAAATAHLKAFDVSDDLSLKIHPKTMLLPENQFYTGIAFKFTLKK